MNANPQTDEPHPDARLLSILRLPGSSEEPPSISDNGESLRSPATGATYARLPYLDLLGESFSPTVVQRALDTSLTAWFYDRARDWFMRRAASPDFSQEMARIKSRLALEPGDTVLDLACGHGNFTLALAEIVGRDGAVFGLDISRAMLTRAARRIPQNRDAGGNVVLIRGDALALPFADGAFGKVNCSGGFHQLPNLSRALDEIARVTRPEARLTASAFATYPEDGRLRLKRRLVMGGGQFVAVDWLEAELAKRNFHHFEWEIPGGWFGYFFATKRT